MNSSYEMGFIDMDIQYFDVHWKYNVGYLKNIAIQEYWGQNNSILVNYIVNTIRKLNVENKIVINDDFGLFNTGLFTNNYEPIYAFRKAGDDQKIRFMTDYELMNEEIYDRPERANYFENPDLLIFD